eukprot:GHVH01011153.1.p1 GENE.GHVH01011153.1~~GHVH01011153.1.p1  ORF type:complete len:1147 (+),score=171.32 GHVH01011153.1:172-3612(+)
MSEELEAGSSGDVYVSARPKRIDVLVSGTPQMTPTLGSNRQYAAKVNSNVKAPDLKGVDDIVTGVAGSKNKETTEGPTSKRTSQNGKKAVESPREEQEEIDATTATPFETMLTSRVMCLDWQWSDILPRLVAPFLTFQDVLHVRRASRTMYFGRRFRLGQVDITPFAFIGQSAVWHYVLPMAIRTCTPGALQKISFRGCTMLSDTFYTALFSDASILPSTLLSVTVENQTPDLFPTPSSAPPNNGSPVTEEPKIGSLSQEAVVRPRSPSASAPKSDSAVDQQKVDCPIYPAPVKMIHCSLKSLRLDFCPQVTDRTLDILLNIHFPRLESISFQCVRSNLLTGEPFIRLLDKSMWPRFHELDSTFTHMTLQALDLASSFALARALDIGTTPKIKIEGSLASVAFFKVLGLDQVHQSYRRTIEMGDLDALEKTVKYFEQAYSTQVESPGLKRMILCRLLRHNSIELLMNAPLTTAVAAEKLRKHDIVSKAKLSAANEADGAPEAEDPLTEANDVSKSPQTGSELPSAAPAFADTETVKKEPPSKEISSSVTRWTYPIYTAVRHGHRQIVEYLLKSGAVFNIVDYDGSTPLHVATTYACQASESSLGGGGGEMLGNLLNSEGDEDEVMRRANIVHLLLGWDCNVNALDVNSRRWPINAAAKYDNAPLVDMLVAAGARVNFPGCTVGNLTGESGPKGPLLVACEAELVSTRAIKALVNAGADVIGMSSKGRCTGGASPILTVYRRAPKLLELFLDVVGKDKLKNEDKAVFDVLSELLSTAITKADLSTVKLLCTSIPQLLRREHAIWSAPIHQAAKLQDPDVLQYIMDQYIKNDWENFLTDPDSSGRTPLMVASLDNSFLGVKALLDKGVDVNCTDHNNYTSLMMTCENNLWTIAYLLIKAGTDVNIQSTDDGNTALMLSIIYRQERISLKLIDKFDDYKLDLNIKDHEGRTALMLACFFGMFKVAAELMNCNCDVTITDVNGQTAESILKKKIDATASSTVGGIRNSVARKIGKLSRIGRDRSISSKVSRKEKWDDLDMPEPTASASDKNFNATSSLAASEIVRFDAANLSVSEGDRGGLQDEDMMRDLQDRTKKAAQKLLKQIREQIREQEHSPMRSTDRHSPKRSSGASSKSSISSKFSRSGSVIDR